MANLCLLFLPAYLPFLNPIEEVFGWLKQVVKQGTPTGTEDLFDLLQAGCGVPVQQSPGVSWIVARDCLEGGSKWAFIHSQKEDPLGNLLVYGPGVKETIWICQYLEFSNNILDSLYLVLNFCSLVLDICSLNLDSGTLNLDSSSLESDFCAALRIQLLILGLLLRYLGLQL
ncbi:hypothetical protein DSO57_1008522 [Entomophthora muscae]|uniref:Uncharacterized protein n=1 Tax=Entomophthora muscae TaxID=34485 RepID=A0ACC2UGQ7_9FUNG|nr:hypothetical protein DSO57_1008522 [Entomophthora muscae]